MVFNTRNKFNRSDPFLLNVISSLAIYKVLSQYLNEKEIHIKWPNDVLFEFKKIAGILIQNIYRGQDLYWTVIGMGINLNQQNFEENLKATSMYQILNKVTDRYEFLNQLHEELMNYYNQFLQGKADTLLQIYNEKLYGRNQICNLQKPNEELIQAKIRSVDRHGMLNVELGNKVQAYDFSEVRIVY